MKRILVLIAVLAGALCGRSEEPVIARGSVVVVPVKDAITEAQFFFLRRVLKQAESAGASALVFDMDTPGGELKATERIVQMLSNSPLPA